MQEDRPSSTAHRVARLRAVHQILDHPRIFTDPLAVPILGAGAEDGLRAGLSRFEQPGARMLRAFMAVRSRLAEDELARAVERGVRQYVVLGAGLDTFAYRNPHPELRVLEVDHPATQAWKRSLLAEAGIAVPASLTFAPVDFERQTLVDGLAQAGFESGRPAFFSWLGVVPYLTEQTVLDTLGWVAARPPGSGIVFDYAPPPESVSGPARLAFDGLAERVAARGEPWQTYFDPPALVHALTRMGFGAVEDLDAEALNARYFRGRTDGLRLFGVGRLLSARVAKN